MSEKEEGQDPEVVFLATRHVRARILFETSLKHQLVLHSLLSIHVH